MAESRGLTSAQTEALAAFTEQHGDFWLAALWRAYTAATDPTRELTSNTIRATQAINAARSARWMAGSPGWTTLEIAGELAGEVGELANICKKLRRSEMGVPGNKVSDEELREQARGEIADVFIVLMLTASKLGVDLEDAVRETFNRKSEQMGFPERIPGRSGDGIPPAELIEAIRVSVNPEDKTALAALDVVAERLAPERVDAPATVRSCNRHNNCDAADADAVARGKLGASHCHDDGCDECFGN